MQDKSINSALLALRKQIIRGDLDGLAHVETLLTMRDVPMPVVYAAKCPTTARRNHMRWMVLDALRERPMTRKELVAHIAAKRPDVPPERIYWRVDAALSKVRMDGLVRREGRLWQVSN